MSDVLKEARKRIDEFLNIDVPLMVARDQLSYVQLFETVGVLGLWMRAVVGEVDDEIARAIAMFVQAMADTYAHDTRPLAAKLQVHLQSAFKDNPALVRMRQLIDSAMTSAPDDAHVTASRAFIEHATKPSSSPETTVYFEILLGAG